MAQDSTVSFKAYLLYADASNGKTEVRRFGVDRDAVSSFDYLKEKLKAIFPTLNNKNFSIIWKDADNDDVVISSDDELMIALSEMQCDVRKLYIKILDASSYPPNPGARPCNEATDYAHEGIICNVCDKQIQGFRYHCMECLDYDLCGKCEAKKRHSEHIVVRLAVPVPTNVLREFQGPVRTQLDALKGHHRHGHRREPQYFYGRHSRPELDAMDPDKSNKRPEACKSANKKGKQNASAEFVRKHSGKKEYLWSMGQGTADHLDLCGFDVHIEVRDENVNNKEEGKKEDNMETEEAEKDEVQNKDPKCNGREGSNEAGPSQASETRVAQSKRAARQTDDWTVLNPIIAEQQQENYAPMEFGVDISLNQAQGEGAVPSIILQPRSGVPARERRMPPYTGTRMPTMGRRSERLEPTGLPLPSGFPLSSRIPLSTGIPTSGIPLSSGIPTSRLNIYNISEARPPATRSYYPWCGPTYSNTFTPQTYSTHTRPHVAEAVQKMILMGFSNEGGWLTQLLEMKNGDIEKALDVLQPVKRS